mmetsp:Transcript_41574/g.77357  ORF Transcript_41574/g.77357 Transcript_41574/m.77357 type:complete len:867 (-) Transcript_41574:64-2664(-)
MAPLAPPPPPTKSRVRASFQAAAKNAVTSHRVSISLKASAKKDEEAAKSDLTATQFGAFLSQKPDTRDEEDVQAALDWWLETLPSSGRELAPELRAPASTLFEVFRRGKVSFCVDKQIVQEEGDEVRSYSIVLFGSCRLRCGRPAPSRGKDTDGVEKVEETFVGDHDGFVSCEVVGRGESLGLVPGEQRSPYNVVCTEKTTLLRLTGPDYEATLRPYHRGVFQRTVEFLQRHRICPEATSWQLGRLAPFLRQRRLPRGTTVVRGGESQRHIWVLREGACDVLVHNIGDQPVEGDGEEDASPEDLSKHNRLLNLRASSNGAQNQRSAAYNEHRNAILTTMARGPLKQALEGSQKYAFQTGAGQREDLHGAASLREPGVMIGEEIFVYDNYKDWVNSKYTYTVRTTTACNFYTIDISQFRQMITFIGAESVARMVNEKIDRRSNQLHRGKAVARKINRRAQQIQAMELEKAQRQQLRLPPCAGYDGICELEDVNDWLGVVFDHRKGPQNSTNLPTLTCLEGTDYGPKCNKNGPGVKAMLRVASDPGRRQGDFLGPNLRRARSQLRLTSAYDSNPMGGIVSADARYTETSPSGFSPALSDGALEDGAAEAEEPAGSGVFFQTEVSFDEPPPHGMSKSMSMPNMSHLEDEMTSALASALASAMPTAAPSTVAPAISEEDASSKAGSAKASKSAAFKRQQRVVKAFDKAMPGKAILILTDKKSLVKAITNVILMEDVTVVFVKSSNDLWQRLRSPKETYHLLMIDLTKPELHVEPILRTIRQGERYGQMPIVVLSAERELPEMVRSSCSFVVFLPLAAAMLREALVWCFDRRSVQKLFRLEVQPQEDQELQIVKGTAPAQPAAPPALAVAA